MRRMVDGAREGVAMSAVVDFPVKPEARPYLDAFERGVGRAAQDDRRRLVQARRQALTRFGELGFPTRKSEAWRYLDLQPLIRQPLLPMEPQQEEPGLAIVRERIARLDLPESNLRLVLVDGLSARDLSTVHASRGDGFRFGSCVSDAAGKKELSPDLVQGVPGDAAHPFAALNEAFFTDGYILQVQDGVTLDDPVIVVHFASGLAEGSLHTRSLIALGAGSRASLVEVYLGEARYWRNDVVAARLGEGAQLSRTVLVEEGAGAAHITLFDARLAARARLASFALLLGGHRVRGEANIRFDGEGGCCEVNGAFLAAGNDEANVVTAIDHAAPLCRTSELVKGVAAGHGHGAFQGGITVRPHAQKTDAHQLSRNLIIGRRAAIDTKPELQIDADDVKCSHGASVGDLDEAALFYLRARGIPAPEARRLLVEGFLSESVETVGNEDWRAFLLRRLAARLGALEE